MAETTKAVKTALRIKSGTFDEEIAHLIAAAEKDLEIMGIKGSSNDDPLYIRAIILYCKANFGSFDDSEKYEKAYNNLKCALSLTGEYHVE